MSISLSNILKELPEAEATDYRSLNRSLFKELNKACIVIDDDPTGNQTVYGIPLLSSWTVEVLVNELRQSPVFFLLTNSRSLSAGETEKVYKEIAENIDKASKITRKNYSIISRSDSTLRGHFPLEPSTLKASLNLEKAVTVFIPVMFEGKRVTVNDTHFIKDKDVLTPVNETPFAQDHSFKYTKANLKEYIEEKTERQIYASEVYSFSLGTIRKNSIEELSQDIFNLPDSCYCIFNSVNYADLDKVANALLLAEKKGKQIMYRTSSSFVPSYIGLKPKDILSVEDLLEKPTNNGGLTIVGSYVKKSSEQLKEALQLFEINSIFEIDIEKILNDNSQEYLKIIVARIRSNLKEGKDTIVYTSRKLLIGSDVSTTINIASTISNALVSIVNRLDVKPKYLIAKGGITSHDIAIKGLEMKRSKVIGQIQPGIPVWKMDNLTKFPNLKYIVFPGNVGDNNTLSKIIKKLS